MDAADRRRERGCYAAPGTAVERELQLTRARCEVPYLRTQRLKNCDGPGFVALAEQLRAVFEDLDRGNVDAAAQRLNGLLARHPANPHLAKEDGIWRLHHHPADAALLPMWTSICVKGIARMIGAQNAHRLGLCTATNCDRVYADTTKNASRRFCSIACQNRTKTAAFRKRQIDDGSSIR